MLTRLPDGPCVLVTECRLWRTGRLRTIIGEYDRRMAGEQDHSGRFDYLFEPLDVDMANTDVIVASAVEQADADDRRSRTAATRFGIAAVVVAMVAVATATVLFLLQRPTPRLASTLRSARLRRLLSSRSRQSSPSSSRRHRSPRPASSLRRRRRSLPRNLNRTYSRRRSRHRRFRHRQRQRRQWRPARRNASRRHQRCVRR